MDVEKMAGQILSTKLPPVVPNVEEVIEGSILICEFQDGSILVFYHEYGVVEEHEYYLSWEHFTSFSGNVKDEYDNLSENVLGSHIIKNNPDVLAVYMGVML